MFSIVSDTELRVDSMLPTNVTSAYFAYALPLTTPPLLEFRKSCQAYWFSPSAPQTAAQTAQYSALGSFAAES